MKFVYHFEAMTTPCEVMLYATDRKVADSIAKLILKETKRLEKKYNYFDENSFLSGINSRKVRELDKETILLLQKAKYYYKKTNKIFDITVGTIKDIYIISQTIKELEKLKTKMQPFIGCEHFMIKKGKIYFDNPYTKLDLGGFVKEYSVDRAVSILKKYKIKSALVNFGGDIFALGKKPDDTKYKIGIKDPKQPNKFFTFIEITDEALTTSASYERNITIENNNFSHIISKEKRKQPNSVTVVSKSCIESGVFSTALMIDSSLNIGHLSKIIS